LLPKALPHRLTTEFHSVRSVEARPTGSWIPPPDRRVVLADQQPMEAQDCRTSGMAITNTAGSPAFTKWQRKSLCRS